MWLMWATARVHSYQQQTTTNHGYFVSLPLSLKIYQAVKSSTNLEKQTFICWPWEPNRLQLKNTQAKKENIFTNFQIHSAFVNNVATLQKKAKLEILQVLQHRQEGTKSKKHVRTCTVWSHWFSCETHLSLPPPLSPKFHWSTSSRADTADCEC